MNITLTLTPELRLEQALKQAGIEDLASVIKLTVISAVYADPPSHSIWDKITCFWDKITSSLKMIFVFLPKHN